LSAIGASLLSAGPQRNVTLEDLIHAIGSRELLLVLDNCEHVIQEAATICERLIQADPNLKILATSREPLRPASNKFTGCRRSRCHAKMLCKTTFSSAAQPVCSLHVLARATRIFEPTGRASA
jgi:predicted ATPase